MLFCKSHLMSKYPYGALSLAMSLLPEKNRKSQFATIKKTEQENKVWIQFHIGLRTQCWLSLSSLVLQRCFRTQQAPLNLKFMNGRESL